MRWLALLLLLLAPLAHAQEFQRLPCRPSLGHTAAPLAHAQEFQPPGLEPTSAAYAA